MRRFTKLHRVAIPIAEKVNYDNVTESQFSSTIFTKGIQPHDVKVNLFICELKMVLKIQIQERKSTLFVNIQIT